MGDAARHLLKSFEALSEADRREVLEQLLRRASELPYSFPSDEELLRAATRAAEPAFAKVWDNDDDAAYDKL